MPFPPSASKDKPNPFAGSGDQADPSPVEPSNVQGTEPAPEEKDSGESKPSYRALVDEMGKLYERMRGIVDAANETGEMEPKVEVELDRCRNRYEQLRKLKERNIELSQITPSYNNKPAIITRSLKAAIQPTETNEYRDAFAQYLKNPRNMSESETRALNETTAADGGYLPSQEFYGQLIKILSENVVFRKFANVISVGAFKTNIAFEGAITTATWGAEAAAFTETTPAFAQLVLQPRRLSALVKTSLELMEDAPARGASFSVETIVTDQLGRAFAQAEESAFCNGLGGGSNQPVGVFKYTSSGQIATGVTTAAANAITANNILDLIYSLPRAYRELPSTCMVMHDSTLAAIRKISTPATANGYLWQPSFILGEPDRISGIPIHVSPYAPVIGANAYPIIIGDFSRYHIAQRSSVAVKVLRELYAANGQVGFVGTERLDAGISTYEAFKYLKMAAS